MDSITNRSSPTLGMGAASNTLPSGGRSFRITSPWSELHPNKASSGSAKAHGKDADGRQISIFATVVEVSRSKTGSLRSKFGSFRPKDSRVRIVRPDIFESSTFDISRQQMTPPDRSMSAPPVPRVREQMFLPNRSNSAPPVDGIWQQISLPGRGFIPPVDSIEEHVPVTSPVTSVLPVDKIEEHVPPMDRSPFTAPVNNAKEEVPIDTKQQIFPPNLEVSPPHTPKILTRKHTLRERTQSRLTGLKNKFFRSSSRKPSLSLPEICSELAQIPAEEISNPQIAKCKIFKEEPIKLEVKSLGSKKFKMLLPISHKASGLGITEEEGEGDDDTCDRFIEMLPESCQHISQRASPLGLVPKLFPHGKVRGNVRYVAGCFWIWLCMVDDLSESLVGQDWKFVESDLIQVFTDNGDEGYYNNPDGDAVKVSLALRTVIDTTELNVNDSHAAETAWRENFKAAVREVLAGFQFERTLLESKKVSLAEWMRVRMVTISARPFMILAKASLGLEPVLSPSGNPLLENPIPASPDHSGENILMKVECILQLVMGLQNDILGWERDKKGNSLNTVQVLAKGGMKPAVAMKDVVNMHNELVQNLSDYGERAWNNSLQTPNSPLADVSDFLAPPTLPFGNVTEFGASSVTLWPEFKRNSRLSRRESAPDDNIRAYLELVMGFANGLANWMVVSKRDASMATP